ncbi:MAG: glycerol-3-phosphate dehydrogenase subunit GlpB [Haloquadratum sp.]
MPIESDVLVIGGGLAGITSALAAAREGASVRLVTHKQSTLRQASGLVDVLGYLPDGTGPVSEPLAHIPALPAAHPYSTVGVAAVREALSLFDDVTDYAGGHTDANALVPTHGGTVKPTARYPQSAAAGLASDDRPALLVGFASRTDFDAPHAAAHLRAAGVPFDVRGATVAFPGDLRADATITRYATLLDENAPVSPHDASAATGARSDRTGRAEHTAREALAARVRDHLDGEARVGFPAVLGECDPGGVRDALAARLGVDVFEVPMGPPSLPGIRLEAQLSAALDAHDVRVASGTPVVDYRVEGRTSNRIAAVVVERNGAETPMAADQYVLATGGLVGGGIDSDRARVSEPIFGCHLDHPDDRYEWFDDDAFGDHPFARFGLRTDGDLRPLDSAGSVEFPNLRAAGSVLGGYDFAAEKSGGGVSLATGYAAGRGAAREASAR